MSLHVAITDKSEAIYGGGFTFPRKSGCSGIMKKLFRHLHQYILKYAVSNQVIL